MSYRRDQQEVSSTIPIFSRHGTELSVKERQTIAKNRGLCITCGTKTHHVKPWGRIPIKNIDGKVHRGICIKCNPDILDLKEVFKFCKELEGVTNDDNDNKNNSNNTRSSDKQRSSSIVERLELSGDCIRTDSKKFHKIGRPGFADLVDSLRKNSSVKEVILESCSSYLDRKGIEGLLHALSVGEKCIERIRINNVQIDNSCSNNRLKALFRSRNVKKLKCLSLTSAGIDNVGATEIATDLLKEGYSLIRRLDLENNHIRFAGTKAIGQSIRANRRLWYLNISRNKFGNTGISALVDGLKYNKSIEILSLEGNNISFDGALSLGELITTNAFIKKLKLAHNRLCNEGASVIFDCLVLNSTIEHLDLASNYLGNDAMLSLGLALRVNEALKELILCHNKIGYNDTENIITSFVENLMERHSTLETLDLGDNAIADFFGAITLSALISSNSIKEINLANNNIGVDGITAIAASLSMDGVLVEKVDLRSNIVTGTEYNNILIAFGKMLQTNKHLNSLDLSTILKFDTTDMLTSESFDEGTSALLLGLRNNQFITEFKISHLTDTGHRQVVHYLKINKTCHPVLRNNNNAVPLSLWPSILAKSSDDLDIIFFYLREMPDLFKQYGRTEFIESFE